MRHTPIHAALLNILKQSHAPRTPHELLSLLKKRGLTVNKTTVYRQLDTLTRTKVVEAVHFTDRVTRYEISDVNGHHHHLVCLVCGRIEDVSFPSDIEKQQKFIWKKNNFKVLQHSLEFFGHCRRCQRN